MMFSAIPIWTIDIIGAVVMIVLSFLCLLRVRELINHDRNNVIWTYLLWVCYGLAGFAISRSSGHILKQILLFSGHSATWHTIRPISGAINTLMFVLVASITLFFGKIWKIYQQISNDKQALQSAHQQLLYLNRNLEHIVDERTRALSRSEHKYRRIFEVSKDMILVTKKDGSILDLNPAGCRMLGIASVDPAANGRRFQDFFINSDFWNTMVATIEKQGFISSFEVHLQNTDNEEIKSLISGSLDAGPGEAGDSIHFLAKDIGQRKLMEKQMARTEKLASIGQLSAGVAHEINNPLGIILGYTQLLLKNNGCEEERHEDLKMIEKHAKNCKSIVEDLLNFARGSEPRKKITRIQDIVDEAVIFLKHHSDLDTIRVETEYDPQVPPMLLDEEKMKQVFINLVINAKHAVGEKGEIKIATRLNRTANQLAVMVSDTGYGIEKENLSRIFDPFFTTKPTGEGTGLGLSVSYGIVKNHGGDILVESRPGAGSTFTVILPFAVETEGTRP